MNKDCKAHYANMYRVRMMEDPCPFCTIDYLTAELADLRERYECKADAHNAALLVIDVLEKELEEAKSECNLWKAENSNAQRSIGIHLNRITSLEKENAAIRMAQAHGGRSDIFMLGGAR